MLKRYGVLGLVSISVSFLLTKILFRKARLIRFPFDIRNNHFIDLGEGLTTGKYCRIEAYPVDSGSAGNVKKLIFGKNVQINDFVHISAGKKVFIGDNVLIASKVFISDILHGSY